MRARIQLLFFLFFPVWVAAQALPDSLRSAFNNAPDGPLKFSAGSKIYSYYQELNRDSALFYADQQLLIARNHQNKIAEGVALVSKSYQLMGLGRFADALSCLQEAFTISENVKNEKGEHWEYFLTPFEGNSRLLLLSYTHHIYALLMLQTGNLEQQIIHFKIAGRIGIELHYAPRILLAYLNLGQSYLTKKDLDSALYFEKEAEQTGLNADQKTFSLSKVYLGTVQQQLGDIYKARGDSSMSLAYYYKSLQTSIANNNRATASRIYLRLTKYHLEKGDRDSALWYSLKNLEVLATLGKVTGAETNLGIGYENLYLSYKLNNRFDSAFKYQSLALVTKDSLNKIRIKDLTEFQNASFQEVIRLQNIEKQKTVYQNKIRTWFLLGGLAVFLLVALILYRNNKQKQKSNKILEGTLTDLKATQSQLIQSEKMASLGELTAGIAHEIQNPLNFVNNFSEVNKELLVEMNEEIDKGNLAEAKSIANDVIENQDKINHHGKRADAIVKGMLQHSRSSSSQKESTDINALADEYLRLAYHGLRAKDNSFNATLKTDFDARIGKINVVPQDIGRVILNLITNAFYASSAKAFSYVKTTEERSATAGAAPLPPPAGGFSAPDYKHEPTVWVSTKKMGEKVLITVRDNGPGIPKKILDKIFQPFFTTKPTGQGTGLGLSLSYDIVKAHGGEISVETKEGEGSVFSIQLPVS